MKLRTVYKVATIILIVAVVVTALYIMAGGIGLSDSLDFGAGAYYYADIPEFDKLEKNATFITKVPLWVHIVLFLAWGFCMYRLWCKVSSDD